MKSLLGDMKPFFQDGNQTTLIFRVKNVGTGSYYKQRGSIVILSVSNLIKTKQDCCKVAETSPVGGQPSLLLIDDDMIFGKTLAMMASKEGISLSYFQCPEQVPPLAFHQADMILVDFELEKMTGLQLISVLEHFLNLPPVLLISSYFKIDKSKWPVSVLNFVPKCLGPVHLLESALRVVSEQRRGQMGER